MLKRRDSDYVTGRRAGLWYKWKRDPLTADCVLMYAPRCKGRRSSFYSDYTFGCWTGDGELLPVGKAYSGITDDELKMLDSFVRNHTLARFGPVREVEKTLVLEVAFDSIHDSKRHKSGVAMRFPRHHRIRPPKPAAASPRAGGSVNQIAPAVLWGGPPAAGGPLAAGYGSSTVSMTWITPFDCITLAIVIFAVSPLASITTQPMPDFLNDSVPPWTVV